MSLGLSPDFCYPRNHDILRGCSTRNQPILHGNLRRFPHEAQHIESSNHPSMIHTTPTIEGPFLLSKHETCNLSTYNMFHYHVCLSHLFARIPVKISNIGFKPCTPSFNMSGVSSVLHQASEQIFLICLPIKPLPGRNG